MPVTVEVLQHDTPGVERVEIIRETPEFVFAQIHTVAKYPEIQAYGARCVIFEGGRVTFNDLPFESRHPIAITDRHVVLVILTNTKLVDEGVFRTVYERG